MPPYTQLQLFERAVAGDVTDTDIVYVNVNGEDKAIPISELATVLGGSAAIAGGETIKVATYGAIGDGVVDDTAAIQDAIDALSLTHGGTVEFSGGANYKITSSLNIPKNFTNGVVVNFLGNGCTITPIGAISAFKRQPTDQTEALNVMISCAITFKGFTFAGAGTAGSKGIELSATYGSVIEQCYFSSLDVGLDLKFCLMVSTRDCLAGNCLNHSFVARIGDWTGATGANSQSNHAIFERCRVYNLTGALTSFFIEQSNGCRVRDCITEGGNPVNNVKYSAIGSNNARHFYIDNLHSENNPSGAICRIQLQGGYARLDGLYHQQPNNIIVDVSGSNPYCVMHIKDINYMPAGSKFTHDGANVVMDFERIGGGGQADLRDSAYWTSSIATLYWRHRGFNNAGGILPKEQGATGPMIQNDLFFNDKIFGTDANSGSAIQILSSSRGAAVADATDNASAILRLNELLARIRAHGLIG